MPKLPTQPENAQVIPLRSGFYALPFNNGSDYLFTRLHQQSNELEEDEEGQSAGGERLFITGIPLGMTEKGLKQTLNKVWTTDDFKIKSIESLASPNATKLNGGPHGVLSLLTKEVTSAQHSTTVTPLFSPEQTSSLPSFSSSSSAVITFASSSKWLLPPSPYPASTSLVISSKSSPSFVSISSLKHSIARPHRSLVTAHVDTWMQAYDSRKLASAPAAYSADVLIAERELALAQSKTKKGKKKLAKQTDVGPLPGSAAAALARHAEEQRKKFDKDHNPDEVQDGEWTLVTGGGKHGKSLLPTDVKPTLEGYGGTTVKVARKKRGKKSEEPEVLDQGIKKIVGEGFYRFNKADSRRKSKRHTPFSQLPFLVESFC
jgi:hypothetical protein